MTKDKTLLSMGGGTERNLNLQMFAEVDNPYINEIKNNLSITGSLAETQVARFYIYSVPLYGDSSQNRLTVEFYDTNTDESIEYVDLDQSMVWPANVRVRSVLNNTTTNTGVIGDPYDQKLYFVLTKKNDETKTPILYYADYGSGAYIKNQINFSNVVTDPTYVMDGSNSITDGIIELGQEYEIRPILIFAIERLSPDAASERCPQYFYDDIAQPVEVSGVVNPDNTHWTLWGSYLILNSNICIPFCGNLDFNILGLSMFDSYTNYEYDNETNNWKIPLWSYNDVPPAPPMPENVIIKNLDTREMIWNDKTKIVMRYEGISGISTRTNISVGLRPVATTPGGTTTINNVYLQNINDANIYADSRTALDIVCKYNNGEVGVTVSTNGSM